MNLSWAKKILSELARQGVRDFVVCAGARNAPLVLALARAENARVASFFDERAAGFFALGVARRTARPVAVITTSGTAAAELLPAACEAFYTGVPLLLVTADRPRRLRGTGAPQSINQLKLFNNFVAHEIDIESGEDFDLKAWRRRAPVHINVCFDEPLVTETLAAWQLSEDHLTADDAFSPTLAGDTLDKLSEFTEKKDRLVAIVASLETAPERQAVKRFLMQLNVPTYLEATSGLREDPDLHEIALKSGDRVLSWALKNHLLRKVLRIGGIPTVRVWRDLDRPPGATANDAVSECETFSVSSLPFAGLNGGTLAVCDLACTLAPLASAVKVGKDFELTHQSHKAIFAKDQEVTERLERLFRSEPRAEPSLVRAISQLVKPTEFVYVGNSLPIREWDFAAERVGKTMPVAANRGVNGIDGQLTTFFAMAHASVCNWGVFGDLTALYDLSAPWALRVRDELQTVSMVINNSGGKIFSRIFGDALFENRHDLNFKDWAAMWRLDYHAWQDVPVGWRPRAKNSLVELQPDAEATERFWRRYDEFWM